MISRSTEYAFRIMAFLALSEQDSPHKSRDIATETGVPQAYLAKVLRRMVTARLLVASKGHGGGFMIAKAPRDITFKQILEAVQDAEPVTPCVFGWNACNDRAPCVLHQRWKGMRTEFETWANGTTLADVRSDVEGNPNFVGRTLVECLRREG